ncbi:hypothetical protein LTS16_026654, partial [Friedmanniomyces endolithicus]
MAKLMERNNSSAGCDVQTILEEIESLRSRLRKATADLYAVQGKSSVEEGNFEQNVDPLLQRNEHLAQQLAETQDKLHACTAENQSLRKARDASIAENQSLRQERDETTAKLRLVRQAYTSRECEAMDSSTDLFRQDRQDSNRTSEAHGAEYLQENVTNPLRQPPVCSQPKERLALPEHDGSVGTQNEARTMKPEGSSGERSMLWEEPKPVSQDPVGEDPVAYEEAYPEPVGREVGHSLVDQERTDTGSMLTNIVDHAMRDPEQRDGTGMERTPDDELTRDPLSPRMASTSQAGERMRASPKVPTDDDPDQSRREADGVPRGITIDEHDPVMPNKQSTTQNYTDSPDHEDSKPSGDQCQTSRQASLARDDVAAQVDLVHPSAGQSRKSSSDSTAASLFPPLGELSDADGLVQTSAHENHMEDDPAGKPPSASPSPESCSQVTVAAPAESYPAPLLAMQPDVTAPPEPLETPSPSTESYQTASIACPASTSPITQAVGAAVASSTSPTPNPSNVEAFSSSFAGAAAESPRAASPQPGSPPLSMHTIGSSEDLPVPPTCAKPEATTGPTSPI